jgi:hypothetical protein
LFSMVYKLLLRQLLSFHIHTNTLGVGVKKRTPSESTAEGLDCATLSGLQSPAFNHW